MSTSLIELAMEGTDEARGKLFAQLSEFVTTDLDRRTDQELAIFCDVMLKLYREGLAKDRTQLAQKIAAQANVPRELARKVAEDECSIALPVLATSPVFSQADLLDFADRLDDAHLQILAQRPDLTAEVSDKLVEKGKKPVHRILAGNLKIHFSRKTMLKFVAFAAEDNALLDKLALRSDLPPAACRALLPLVNDDAKKHLHNVIAGSLSQEQLDQIARLKLVRQQFGEALQNTNMGLLWPEAKQAGITLSELVILLLQDNRFDHAVELLAICGRTSQKSFREAVFSGKLDLVLKTSARAGLDTPTFALFAKSRCDRLKVPAARGSEWTAAYVKYLEKNSTPKSICNDFQAKRKSKKKVRKG